MSNSEEQEKPKVKSSGEGNATNLKTGWSAVEDYAWRHDEQSMKVFSEDIDTLLVFAGLFSAVLTAFVVPAYGMLQQDNTQVSADILARISAKLDSFQITPSFINSTVSHNPSASFESASSFIVSTSARWINILWFLSLLFSLSSALFGILAKQWIREYLQWNQTTASPRENILLRQLRSEAWVKWKVPAGIAAIPALLEVAVVLFLVGLIVFVWTLDFVVALVISIAAGIILIAAFIVTTLPAFFQHCPYKSPTGWACAFMYDTITRFTQHIPMWILVIQGRHEEARYRDALARLLPRFHHWRHRDLHINTKLSIEVSSRIEYPPSLWYGNQARREIVRHIAQLRPLVQALAWVHQGSEDARLSSEVARCLDTLPNHDSDFAWMEVQLYGTLHILSKICSKNGEMKHLNLPRGGSLLDAFLKVAGCRIVHGYTLDGLHLVTHDIWVGNPVFKYQLSNYLGNLDSSELRLLSTLILVDLEACFTSELWDPADRNPRMTNRTKKWIAIHIAILRSLFCALNMHFRVFNEVNGRLVEVCNRVRTAANASLYSAYVYGMLLRLACNMGKVCIEAETKELSIVSRSTGQNRGEWICENVDAAFNLTIQIFDENANYADPAARHHFAIMADWVLSQVHYLDEQKKDVLLQKMAEAARISLVNSYLNCGCYHDLPWMSTLRKLDSSDIERIRPQSLSSLLDILDRFRFVNTSSSKSLKDSDLLDGSGTLVAVITGEGVRQAYEKSRVMIREHVSANRARPTDYLASFPHTSPRISGETIWRDDNDVDKAVTGVTDARPHLHSGPGDDEASDGREQEQGEVCAVNGISDAIIIPSPDSEPAHKGVSTNIPIMAVAEYTGQTQALVSGGEPARATVLPQNDTAPISHSTPASIDDHAPGPGDDGTDQEKGEFDAVHGISDAIIILPPDLEPFHKSVSTKIPTVATVGYSGQTQALASDGEPARAAVLPQNDTPSISRSTRLPASTDDRGFDPRNPLSIHFAEGVGSLSAQIEQVGVYSGEGPGSRMGSNGGKIEMQEMNRGSIH
ncbi:hypothetical protein PHLCEN_2v12543 [Hermanssonia centrifuga]|uniref:DUF6535 domain-containing protein n=1 Tax=Hermanssonia centrifuga TaxID=98765 RepID=A0A2R6NGX4_9APHY|nr:hypothetical protein PHLCEN_2v12543 [Hermanssonia centrifuga]